ncbi:MAG TPA: hypothetical protein VKM55_21640 [Candidatus Lokiarchaeia archaeon]|nr:hypothetical protein [Candidatus Lokiarchaeia archaeon]
MAINEFTLGARVKRVFIAFLVSFFFSPIQIWLAIEYKNLAKDLDALGAQDRTPQNNLARASALFKKAAGLTIALFVFGIATMVIYYAYYYGMLMSSLSMVYTTSASSPYAILTMEIPMLVMAFIGSIVSIILTIVNYNTLSSAWKLVLSHFQANYAGVFWVPQAAKQIERILKGLKKSIIAAGLTIIEMILLAGLFGFLFTLIEASYSPVPYYATSTMVSYTYGLAALAIAMLCLVIPALVFFFQGIENQGIGLFDLAKTLQGTGAIAKLNAGPGGFQGSLQVQPRGVYPSTTNVPMFVKEARFCPGCGFRIMPEWNALWCPKCGEKLV